MASRLAAVLLPSACLSVGSMSMSVDGSKLDFLGLRCPQRINSAFILACFIRMDCARLASMLVRWERPELCLFSLLHENFRYRYVFENASSIIGK